MSGTEKSSTPARWWEYYFVRYLVGTVVGGLIVFYLSGRANYFRVPVLNDAGSDFQGLAKNFTSLVALSFAYCYVASAPMLTLHATRSSFRHDGLSERKYYIFACIVLSAILDYFGTRHRGYGLLFSLFWYCFIFFIQCLLVVVAYQKRKEIRSFYIELSRARAQGTAHVEDYTESYRHLREHSNAYGIIVLELVLAPAIAWARSALELALIFLLWLVPPALCWFIATMLELGLAASPEQFSQKDKAQLE